jgi:hypothetical protein
LLLIAKRPQQTTLMVFAAGVLSTLFARYVGPLGDITIDGDPL